MTKAHPGLGRKAHELPEESAVADIFVFCAVWVPFVIYLIEQVRMVFPSQMWCGAVYSAVFPAEGAAVVGGEVGEEAGGVLVEVVAEVKAIGWWCCLLFGR